MQFEIEIGGRLRRLLLSRSGDRFIATIDGREVSASATLVDDHTLSLILDDGATFDVTIVAPIPNSTEVSVLVGATPVTLSVNHGRRSRAAYDGSHVEGVQRIVAPMSGKVRRVLAKRGDVVTARQPIVVLEAMKMQNELRSARDGIVAEIAAREGSSVDAGALLAVIEPPQART